MVTRTKQGFAVEFETLRPGEDYSHLMSELVGILQDIDPAMRAENNYYYLLQLLREMIPPPESARMMFEDE